MKTVYLGLGSNIGDRQLNLNTALERLDSPGLRVLRSSPVYETEPMEYAAQRWFLNQVAEVECSLFPLQLLARIGSIERAMGRKRVVSKGPRIIDLDILFYGEVVVRSAALEIPHPRIAERRFVLAPLADLAPDLRHPVTARTVRQMLQHAPAEKIRRVDSPLLNS